jgi:hypothetical protein
MASGRRNSFRHLSESALRRWMAQSDASDFPSRECAGDSHRNPEVVGGSVIEVNLGSVQGGHCLPSQTNSNETDHCG